MLKVIHPKFRNVWYREISHTVLWACSEWNTCKRKPLVQLPCYSTRARETRS